MSSINQGNQIIRYDFKNIASSKSFNEINYKLIPPGIYEGGFLVKIDNSHVQITSLTCYITDSLNSLGVNITTQENYTLIVSSLIPYIILRFFWIDTENNYMDILAVDYSSIQDDDLILGRCIFDGSILSSTFDYSLRSISLLKLLNDNKNAFLTTPSEPISNSVYVNPGICIINGKLINFTGNYVTIGSNTILGRNDVVYLDENGLLQILYGVDSSSPVTKQYLTNTFAIAEIKRGTGRNTINGSEIFQIKPNREQYNLQINNNQNLSINSQTTVPSEYVVDKYLVDKLIGYINGLSIYNNILNNTIIEQGLIINLNGTFYKYNSNITLNNTLSTGWWAIAIDELTGTISRKLIDSYNFPDISNNNWILNSNLQQNQLNLMATYDIIRNYCRIHDGTNYYRLIGIFKYSNFTQNCTLVSGNPSVTTGSTTPLEDTMSVSGTGTASGSYILRISSGTTFDISPAPTGSGIQLLTFNLIDRLIMIEKKPKTKIECYRNTSYTGSTSETRIPLLFIYIDLLKEWDIVTNSFTLSSTKSINLEYFLTDINVTASAYIVRQYINNKVSKQITGGSGTSTLRENISFNKNFHLNKNDNIYFTVLNGIYGNGNTKSEIYINICEIG